MKLDEFNDKTVETAEEFESTEFSIDSESLGVLFKGFSDSLYSDKIGSIVREITSNCFDSHIEAGVTKDVEIEIINENYSGSQAMIIFRDFGMGLSPERVKNIYSKYFASTKRTTYDQIGGFGIGSKSPLSYSDIFTVITRFGGVEYTYMIHRGMSVPEIKLLEKKETDKHNGTEIILTIKSYYDKLRFIGEIKKQLIYFEGITYINCDVPNDYKIYSGKTFLYSPKGKVVNDVYMHAVIGKVAYPINFSQLGYNYLGRNHNVPVAVKFDVGEIPVTMNRELIEYTDKTIKIIESKIDLVKEELQAIYDSQIGETEDIAYAISKAEESNEITLAPGVTVSGGEVITPGSVIYKPFKDIPLKKIFKGDPLSKYINIVCRVDRNGDKDTKKDVYKAKITDLFTSGKVIYRTNIPVIKRKSYYIADSEGNSFWVVSLRKDWMDACKSWLGIASMEQIELIRKEFLKYVIEKSKSYDKVEISDAWLKNYLSVTNSRQAVYKDTSLTHIRKLYLENLDSRGYVPSFSMHDVTMASLAEHCRKGGIIVYANYDDVDTLFKVGMFCSAIPYFYDQGTSWNSRIHFKGNLIKILKVSKETAKKLSVLPNTVPAEKFFEKYRKVVLRTLCAGYVNEQMSRINHYANLGLFDILPEYNGIYSELKKFSETYYLPWDLNLNTNMKALYKLFEPDLQYRYFKSDSRGVDIYEALTKLQNKVKPLVFLEFISTKPLTNTLVSDIKGEFREHLKQYLINNKVFIKTCNKYESN